MMGATKLSKYVMVALILSALVAGLSAGGCTVVRRVEFKTETVSRTVKLKGARSVNAQIKMGAGRLLVGGGADDLLEAELTHSGKAWRPEFDYDVQGGKGDLKVTHSMHQVFVRADRAKWNLSLNDDVPLELSLDLGAGNAQLMLGDLNLSELEISGGVGNTIVDLNGAWDHDVNVEIDHGVGNLTLRLPEDFGARVDVDLGVGRVEADGLKLSGGRYVNDAYKRTKPMLNIEVGQGVGAVTLELIE